MSDGSPIAPSAFDDYVVSVRFEKNGGVVSIKRFFSRPSIRVPKSEDTKNKAHTANHGSLCSSCIDYTNRDCIITKKAALADDDEGCPTGVGRGRSRKVAGLEQGRSRNKAEPR